MRDIVERLREHATPEKLEAADIIEMLRANNLHECPNCGYHGQPHPLSELVKGQK